MNGVESQTLTRASAGGDLERRVAQTRRLTNTVGGPVLREGRDSETSAATEVLIGLQGLSTGAYVSHASES
jgi:hypothetical protein